LRPHYRADYENDATPQAIVNCNRIESGERTSEKNYATTITRTSKTEAKINQDGTGGQMPLLP